MTAPAMSRFTKWTPKTWHPFYTEVVALHAAGFTHEEIATRHRITKQHVCNIVTTPQAKLILANITDKMLKSVEGNIDKNLAVAAGKASERIRDYINDDERFANAGTAVVDRSFKVLSAVGKIRNDNQAGPQQNNFARNMFVMSKESVTELAEALKLTAEVEKRYALPSPPEVING